MKLILRKIADWTSKWIVNIMSFKTEVLHRIKKSNDTLSQLGGLNIFKVKKNLQIRAIK